MTFRAQVSPGLWIYDIDRGQSQGGIARITLGPTPPGPAEPEVTKTIFVSGSRAMGYQVQVLDGDVPLVPVDGATEKVPQGEHRAARFILEGRRNESEKIYEGEIARYVNFLVRAPKGVRT